MRDGKVTLQLELTGKEHRVGRISSTSRGRERKIKPLEEEEETLQQTVQERCRSVKILGTEKEKLKRDGQEKESEHPRMDEDIRSLKKRLRDRCTKIESFREERVDLTKETAGRRRENQGFGKR